MADRPSRVVVEADGGSRGNPGPAAYGAVLKDADTGERIADDAAGIGTATNNVAEYRGLVSGLQLATTYAPGAEVEVRMDSKLVVEQMSGRWKIKHPDMRSLALEAQRAAPPGTRYTWVPRARNVDADAVLNEVLDGSREPGVRSYLHGADGGGVGAGGAGGGGDDGGRDGQLELGLDAATPDAGAAAPPPDQGWSPGAGPATTLLLVRHGATALTARKAFSGSGGTDPSLSGEGRAQVRALGALLGPLAGERPVLVTSPLARARQTAEVLADLVAARSGAAGGPELQVEPGLAELDFGAWEGRTAAEVAAEDPEGWAAWRASTAVPTPRGESVEACRDRVLLARDRLLARWPGRAVVVVSHVTPVKVLVADALGAPLDAVFRMELAPASLSVVSHAGPDAAASLRLFNARA